MRLTDHQIAVIKFTAREIWGAGEAALPIQRMAEATGVLL